jgi:hypothetical protein
LVDHQSPCCFEGPGILRYDPIAFAPDDLCIMPTPLFNYDRDDLLCYVINANPVAQFPNRAGRHSEHRK